MNNNIFKNLPLLISLVAQSSISLAMVKASPQADAQTQRPHQNEPKISLTQLQEKINKLIEQVTQLKKKQSTELQEINKLNEHEISKLYAQIDQLKNRYQLEEQKQIKIAQLEELFKLYSKESQGTEYEELIPLLERGSVLEFTYDPDAHLTGIHTMIKHANIVRGTARDCAEILALAELKNNLPDCIYKLICEICNDINEINYKIYSLEHGIKVDHGKSDIKWKSIPVDVSKPPVPRINRLHNNF